MVYQQKNKNKKIKHQSNCRLCWIGEKCQQPQLWCLCFECYLLGCDNLVSSQQLLGALLCKWFLVLFLFYFFIILLHFFFTFFPIFLQDPKDSIETNDIKIWTVLLKLDFIVCACMYGESALSVEKYFFISRAVTVAEVWSQ